MAAKNNPNLLDEIDKEETAAPSGTTDVLDEIDETNAQVWRPDLNSGAADDQPTGLQGKVIATGYGPYGFEGASIPWVEIRTAAGDWVIRGYGNVLIQEIEKAGPKRGGTFAVKYFGRKEGRSKDGKPGKKYHHYKARFVASPDGGDGGGSPTGETRTPF